MTITELLRIVPQTMWNEPLALETPQSRQPVRVRSVRVDTSDTETPIVLVGAA
jgi:hypothetical protein